MSLHFVIVLVVLAADSCCMQISQKKNLGNLNGAHLKFAATDYPPYNVLSLQTDGNYTDTGSNPMIFAWLAEKLNFTISYYYIPIEIIETKYKNMGDIAILLSLITDKKVDGSSRFVIETAQRYKIVDFPYFMWADPLTMVVPRLGEEPRLFAFIWPFQSSVWLLIFIVVIAIAVAMTLFSRILSAFVTTDRKIPVSTCRCAADYSMYVIKIITNQGGTVTVRHNSFRILVGLWLLVAMVLVNSYSGIVISYLTVPRMKPSINTLEDVAASKDTEIILLADSVIHQQIFNAESGAMKILGDNIRKNPELIANNINTVNVRLKTGKYAFPYSESFCHYFVASHFKEYENPRGKCHFKTTDHLDKTTFWSLPLQKDNKYTPIFKNALIALWETGLPQCWVKKCVPRAPKCFDKAKPRVAVEGKVPIPLKDLAGAFLILGIGVSLGTFVFLLEKINHFSTRTTT